MNLEDLAFAATGTVDERHDAAGAAARRAALQGREAPADRRADARRMEARRGDSRRAPAVGALRISVGTVRKAIDELVAENILIRQQGRGTFVASHNRDREVFYFFHVVPERGPKQYPDVQLTGVRARHGPIARRPKRLDIEPGDRVVRIRNLLRLDGRPVIVDDITLPALRFAGLTERQFARAALDDLQPVPGSVRHFGRQDARARCAQRGGRRRSRRCST